MKLDNILNSMKNYRRRYRFITFESFYILLSIISVTLAINASSIGVTLSIVALVSVILGSWSGINYFLSRKSAKIEQQAHALINECLISKEYSVPHLYCLFMDNYRDNQLTGRNKLADKLLAINQLEKKDYAFLNTYKGQIICSQEDIENILSDERISLNFICAWVNMNLGITQKNLSRVCLNAQKVKEYSGSKERLIKLVEFVKVDKQDLELVEALEKKIGFEKTHQAIEVGNNSLVQMIKPKQNYDFLSLEK